MVSVVSLTGLGGSAFADQRTTHDDNVRLGIVTPSVVLEDDGMFYRGVVTFAISGGQGMSLHVEALDTWIDALGQRISLPQGSTPFSGEGRLTLALDSSDYVPNGLVQNVNVSLSLPSESVAKAPLMTGIKVTLHDTDDDSSGSGITILRSALAFVYAAPDDATLLQRGFFPEVTLKDLMVTPLETDMSAERTQPLTFVDGQKVAIAFHSANAGALFGFVTHHLTVEKQRWPWSRVDDGDSPLFERSLSEIVLIPGESRWDYVPVVGSLSGSGQEVELLGQWGLYSATVTTAVRTGGDSPSQTVSTVTFVVFPIRLTLTILLVVVISLFTAYRMGRGRGDRQDAESLEGAGPTSPSGTNADTKHHPA